MLTRAALIVAMSLSMMSVERPVTLASQTGVKVVPVLDNATTAVVRLQLAPGAAEQPHTHAHSTVVVLLSRGDLEIQNGAAHAKGPHAPGHMAYVKAGATHQVKNAGATPLDALVVSIKPDRVRAGTAPMVWATPGVMRTPLLDNADVMVTRLEYEPDAREPLHDHNYDLLILPTTASRIDLQLGDKKLVRSYTLGEAIFIRRRVPHAIAHIGAGSFRAVTVAFK
jgi:quercetin dioxygenase-like cupin family protein